MRRERIFLILGIWLAVLPYLGFPYFWKNVLCTLSGLVLIYYSYVLYQEYKTKNLEGSRQGGAIGTGKNETFSENNPYN